MQPIHAFTIVTVLVFTIPVFAVIGGIIAGILKAQGRQRLAELIQRERIAAIERGIDPSKLPPLPGLGGPDFRAIASLVPGPAQKAQGFLVTGIVLLGLAVGLIAMLLLLTGTRGGNAWASGLVPLSLAIALIVSSFIVRRSNGGDASGGPKA